MTFSLFSLPLSLFLSVSQAPRSPHGPAAPAAAAAHQLAGRHGGAHQEDGFSATGSGPGGRQAPSGGAQGGLASIRLMCSEGINVGSDASTGYFGLINIGQSE